MELSAKPSIKKKAIESRRLGYSLRDISKKLVIPKSTLSGWFKDVILSANQKRALRERWQESLKTARKSAVRWHNQQKEKRVRLSHEQALTVMGKIDDSLESLELALAMLYLGEGYKKRGLGMGNSDPKILRFFINTIKRLYNISEKNIKADLNLRADQDPTEMKKYWSKQLSLPLENFRGAIADKRTLGSKTYPSYKGVCQLTCAGIGFQRRLLFIASLYCDKVSRM